MDERERLENELDRIEQQLEERERIYEEVSGELESTLDWYLDRLGTLCKHHWRKHGLRDDLKQRIRELYGEIRQEKRDHWRDSQKLEQERRELLRELSELDETDSILDLLWRVRETDGCSGYVLIKF